MFGIQKLKETNRSDRGWTDFSFNMACWEDFYAGEKLEAIFEAIGENIWDKDVRLTAEVDDLIRQSETEPPKYGFKCEKCEKLSSQNKVSVGIKI